MARRLWEKFELEFVVSRGPAGLWGSTAGDLVARDGGTSPSPPRARANYDWSSSTRPIACRNH